MPLPRLHRSDRRERVGESGRPSVPEPTREKEPQLSSAPVRGEFLHFRRFTRYGRKDSRLGDRFTRCHRMTVGYSREAISSRMRLTNSSVVIVTESFWRRWRTATPPVDASLSPITSMYGICCSCASRMR